MKKRFIEPDVLEPTIKPPQQIANTLLVKKNAKNWIS